MSDGELLDAREAMSLLGVNETDLQTMVARGSLRAFRSAGTMKFRRDDVLGIKGEKKTDPTIIMPSGAAKKPGSGILPTVKSAKSPRGSSHNLPAVKPTLPPAKKAVAAPIVDNSTSADQIILEEFELAPAEGEGASNTQQVTASQTAVGGGVTVVDNSVETGNQTVVDQSGIEIDTASATASAIAPVAVSPSGSGRSNKVPSSRLGDPALPSPAMSRVKARAVSADQTSAARRAQTTVSARTSHPIMTFVLILTAGIYLYAATVVGVQLFKGNYDAETKQRVIPPFLVDSPFVSYQKAYVALPGTPADDEGEFKRPSQEPAGGAAPVK